jgi:gliding motility-associated-like protein
VKVGWGNCLYLWAMKKTFFLLLFLLQNQIIFSQITLSNNEGDDVKFKNMFSCYQTEWWAREFILSDFGISENEEFSIKSGRIAINYSYSGASHQYNIYEIDENFPTSFDKSKLLGSSQIETLPSAYGSTPTFVSLEFNKPIIIPADVKKILVEVKKTVTPRNPAVSLATIAGTDKGVGFSWYKGCINIGNGTGYQSTENFGGLYPGIPDANFYITVNGEAKTILPFSITNDNNCSNFSNNLSLTNQPEIQSVVWNFDDPSSGINNTSNAFDVNHQFTSSGIYNVTATVTHSDNTVYTIPKKIEIFDVPDASKKVSLKQCDNSDINGFSFFNLNEVKEKIISNSESYTISFYEEKVLAENKGTAITNITQYENEQVSSDTIWARVENANGCFSVSEVNLLVSTTQIPLNYSKSFYKCDDGTDTTDGIATFNFSEVTNEILAIFPANQQLEITYYQSEVDALSEENKIDNISNYQNTDSPNQQTIYIRVDSNIDNACLGLGAHITLNVETVPIANPVNIKPQCDNDRDGLFSFDTSTIQSTIVGSQTNVAVSYFDENGTQLSSPLPNPFVTASQNIIARIESTTSKDTDGKCYDETQINFVVTSVPVANKINIQEACDDDFDGIATFDTSQIASTVLGSQTGLILKYFDANNNPLPSPLPNPFTTASQTIKVRIENPNYDICFEETTVEFLVHPKPNFSLISEDIICINNNPRLPIQVENPLGNYTYTWKDESGNIVGTSATIEVTRGGVYTVIATSNKGCNSDAQSITIKESSISTISISDIQVQDDSDHNFIKVNASNLGLGNYEFRLLDLNYNIIFDYQSDGFFNNLDKGNYILEVNDLNNCGSIPFEIALIGFPSFFTPNGDHKNDFWQIQGIDKSVYKTGEIKIYNRYGILITTLSINDLGWDGTFNGKNLPSGDFWFQATLIDQQNTIKTRIGNFSLIR